MTLTGIEELDEVLAPLSDDGGVVVFCGPTGRGKTVLAVQTTVNCCRGGAQVAFLSSDLATNERNVLERGLSAACDKPYDQLVDGGLLIGIPGMELGVEIPSLRTFDPAFSARASSVYHCLRNNLCFRINDGLHADVATGVMEFITDLDRVPQVLIVDWLGSDLDVRAGDTAGGMHKRIKLAMDCLRTWSRKHKALVFVFCQANPAKAKTNIRALRPDAIAEFPELMEFADVFVGISGLGARESEGEGDVSYSDNQYLNVVQGGRKWLVPVLADFGFQRFRARTEDDTDLRERGRRIKLESKHTGWMRLPRKLVDRLVGIGYPPAINVLLLLLLMADHRQGTCFPAQETIATTLGLSRKQVRKALEKLEDDGLIEKHGKARGATSYRIVDFDQLQDPGADFYFKLYRNLRDASRAVLLGNPELFRLWLVCLRTARYKHDTDGVVDMGELLLMPAMLAEQLEMTAEEVETGIGMLAEQGRVTLRESANTGAARIVRVVNWELYQGDYIYRTGDDEV